MSQSSGNGPLPPLLSADAANKMVEEEALKNDEAIAKLLQEEFDQEFSQRGKPRHVQSSPRSRSKSRTNKHDLTSSHTESSVHHSYSLDSIHISDDQSVKSSDSSLSGFVHAITSPIKKTFGTIFSFVKKVSPKIKNGILSTFNSLDKTSAASSLPNFFPLASSRPGRGDKHEHDELFLLDPSQPSDPNYDLFIQFLKEPECSRIVKCIKKFIYEFQCQATELSGVSKGNSYKQFCSFAFYQLKRSLLTSSYAGHALSDAMLADGLERLMMSIIYEGALSASSTSTQDFIVNREINQKMSRFCWVQERHLELSSIPKEGAHYTSCINAIKALHEQKLPKDKIQCIRHLSSSLLQWIENSKASADEYFSRLVFLILQSHVQNLHCQMQFIHNYVSMDLLMGENAYHLTNFNAALSFIRRLSESELAISKREYEQFYFSDDNAGFSGGNLTERTTCSKSDSDIPRSVVEDLSTLAHVDFCRSDPTCNRF